jgi:hypothetical protein
MRIRSVSMSPPVSASITSITSSAFPAEGTRGWFMSVMSAEVMHPAPLAVFTSASASASASAGDAS